MGPVYYQRLKHLVDDKVHGRSTGPLANLTRQPLEGRARKGGLRLGEMERDCMIAHGMSSLLRERLFYASDYYTIYVCNRCHLPAMYDKRTVPKCQICKEEGSISKIELPYACKLLFQEEQLFLKKIKNHFRNFLGQNMIILLNIVLKFMKVRVYMLKIIIY